MKVRIHNFIVTDVRWQPAKRTLWIKLYDTELQTVMFRQTTFQTWGAWRAALNLLQHALHRHIRIPIYREVPGRVTQTQRFASRRLGVAWLRLQWTLADALGVAELFGVKPRRR